MANDDDVGVDDADPIPAVERYVNTDSNSLLSRYDFVGLIGDILKASYLALVSVVFGFVLSLWDAASNIYQAFVGIFTGTVNALTAGSGRVAESAARTAVADLDVFGLFALPVGVAVVGGTILGLIVVYRVFWGDVL